VLDLGVGDRSANHNVRVLEADLVEAWNARDIYKTGHSALAALELQQEVCAPGNDTSTAAQ
jgi:hypothetical protein